MLQHGIDVGTVAREAMQVAREDLSRRTVALYRLDLGVEERHGDRHVGRVRGDAAFARAEDGMDAVEAAERGASGAGLALVAGAGRLVEIEAARALQEIAAGRRLVAKLRRRAGEERLGQNRVARANPFIRGECRIGDLRADS
jgi:hypothetical protein